MRSDLELAEATSSYESLARLAAEICDMSIGVVSLFDSRQWIQTRGAAIENADREAAFRLARDAVLWDDTIRSTGLVEIANLRADARTSSDAALRSESSLLYYAGTALVDPASTPIGTLCVFDRRPRRLEMRHRRALRTVAGTLADGIDSPESAPRRGLVASDMLGRTFDLVADPIAICRDAERDGDLQPVFVYANRAFTDLFEYAFGDVVGLSLDILNGSRLLEIGKSEPVTVFTRSGERRIVKIDVRPLEGTLRIVSFRDFTKEHLAEEALADASLRLQSLLDADGDAIFTVDRLGACIDANPAARSLVGYERDELAGDGLRTLVDVDLFPEGSRFPRALDEGRSMTFTSTYRHRDGRMLDVECTAIPMAVRGVTEGAFILASDVTESRRLADLAKLRARRVNDLSRVAAETEVSDTARIDAALTLVMESLGMQNAYIAETRGRHAVVTNRTGDPIFEIDTAVELSRTRLNFVIERNKVVSISDLAAMPAFPGEVRYDGWHGSICAPLHVEGRTWGTIGFVSRHAGTYDAADRDFVRLVAALVSSAIERRTQQARLDRLAYYDTLTDLPNRAHFMRELERAVAAGAPFAIHFVDLDGFKSLNDRAGHALGDLALAEVGRRLVLLSDEDAMPARLGGDEFVVLQTGVSVSGEAIAYGRRIVETLARPYVLAGQTWDLSASVGIAAYPSDGAEPDRLLRLADAALYRAKSAGKNRVAASGEIAPHADEAGS